MHPQDKDSFTAPTLAIFLALIVTTGAAILAYISIHF